MLRTAPEAMSRTIRSDGAAAPPPPPPPRPPRPPAGAAAVATGAPSRASLTASQREPLENFHDAAPGMSTLAPLARFNNSKCAAGPFAGVVAGAAPRPPRPPRPAARCGETMYADQCESSEKDGPLPPPAPPRPPPPAASPPGPTTVV